MIDNVVYVKEKEAAFKILNLIKQFASHNFTCGLLQMLPLNYSLWIIYGFILFAYKDI